MDRKCPHPPPREKPHCLSAWLPVSMRGQQTRAVSHSLVVNPTNCVWQLVASSWHLSVHSTWWWWLVLYLSHNFIIFPNLKGIASQDWRGRRRRRVVLCTPNFLHMCTQQLRMTGLPIIPAQNSSFCVPFVIILLAFIFSLEPPSIDYLKRHRIWTGDQIQIQTDRPSAHRRSNCESYIKGS